MARTSKVLLVDGNNILIRSIKAMERVPLSSSDGVPTAALNTFIRTLAKFVRQEKPDYLQVCWDGGRSAYRTQIFPGYKAARSEHVGVDDPTSPWGLSKEFLSLAGISHLQVAQVEADDLIAWYWRTSTSRDRIVILSGDKDFWQLLDPRTEIVTPDREDARWTMNRAYGSLRCNPRNLALVMALTGDSGDNVPGIPGFGHKTAVRYLYRHDFDLEAVLEKEPKLYGHAENVRRNLKLVDLRHAGPDLALPEIPKFEPTDQAGLLWPDLLTFTNRYQLAGVRDKLLDGTLWGDERREAVTPA